MNSITALGRHVRLVSVVISLGLMSLGTCHADPKLIRKVAPEFPAEAARRNITDGVVRARLDIDGQGAVKAVQMLDATPPRAKIFNEAAAEALAKWRFEPSGKDEKIEIKLVFSQD